MARVSKRAAAVGFGQICLGDSSSSLSNDVRTSLDLIASAVCLSFKPMALILVASSFSCASFVAILSHADK